MNRRTVAALALVFALVPTTLSAAEPSPEDISAARALGVQGVKLADAGNCKDAISPLLRASAIVSAPSILERLGECQVETGLLVEGTETLSKVAHEHLPPNAPDAFVHAQERAKRVLEKAKPRIASLRITVKSPSEAAVSVTVDGAPVSSVLIGASRPTNPGKRVIAASAPGFLTATSEVSIDEGATREVALELVRDSAAVVAKPAESAPAPIASAAPVLAAPPPVESAAPSPVPPPPPHSSSVLPYVAFGIGVAGVVTGFAFGMSAISDRSSLDDTCVNRACPRGSSNAISKMQTAATISTVTFAIGGAGLLAGTYLLVAAPSSSPASGLILGARGSF